MSIDRLSEPRCRRGFSLSELLVAMTIALMVMAAVASLFGVFGRGLTHSQATVELGGRLRASAWRLRQDLAGVTVDVLPWTRPEANTGYFELVEGQQRDTTFAGHNTTNLEGDTDDILLFTTRSASGPFIGRFGSDTIESDCAEVAWFCREALDQPLSGTKLYNLYRRQLLVMANVGRPEFGTANAIAGALPNTTYDLSMRADGAALLPNSLGDLAKRENRFNRAPTFPYSFIINAITRRPEANATFEGTTREWEDVMLTGVIAFDVRVFDPTVRAHVQAAPTLSYLPGDPSYSPSTAANGSGAFGAYVDMNFTSGTATTSIVESGTGWPPVVAGTIRQPIFWGPGVQVRNAATNNTLNTLPSATYDTWSLHYEFNGENDDGDSLVDEGTNGVDDNADDQPDDPLEYETSPPYPVPLRGVEVRIRCYEQNSKQVRQITVRHAFVKK